MLLHGAKQHWHTSKLCTVGGKTDSFEYQKRSGIMVLVDMQTRISLLFCDRVAAMAQGLVACLIYTNSYVKPSRQLFSLLLLSNTPAIRQEANRVLGLFACQRKRGTVSCSLTSADTI